MTLPDVIRMKKREKGRQKADEKVTSCCIEYEGGGYFVRYEYEVGGELPATF